MKGKTTKRHDRRRELATALILGAMGAAVTEPALAQSVQQISDERIEFDVAAQPLSGALSEFARQARVNALYFSDDLRGLSSPQLRGSYTRQQALDLLLARSGYNGRISGGNLVLAREQSSRPQRGSAANGADTALPSNDANENDSEEIIVTGTRIRGQAPVGSNLITVDRQAIEESGVATTEELMRTLPQVFSGGFAQHVSFQNGNIGGGSSINLRGLGPDATLTLVNGRRLPVMGLRGNFVDVSSIPASAIERVEVLPDSASAIYGSDAVGGVVNFILRRRFEGLEVGARYGGVTEGDLRETRLTAAAGDTFGPLSLFAAYEYFDRSALAMADRLYLADSDLRRFGGGNFDSLRSNPTTLIVSGLGNFGVPSGQNGTGLTQAQLIAGQINLSNINEGLDALPAQTQHALSLSGELELGPILLIYADARYAERSFLSANAHNTQRITIPATNAFRNGLFPGRTVQADYDFYRDLGPRIEDGETKTTDLTLGLRFHASDTWTIEPTLAYARVGSEHFRRNMVNTPALTAALASANPATAFNPFGDGSFSNSAVIESIRGFGSSDLTSETWSIAAKADGELINLPAGPLRVALGGDYRHEFFEIAELSRITTLTPTASISSKNDRNVEAGFVELLAPLFGPGFEPPLGQSIDLSLAGRWENYSDFGETVNPKIGVNWELTDAFSLHASYGESFRAPNLSDLDPANSLSRRQVRGLNIADAGAPSGRSNIILILGANPGLREQTAESWSAGLTFAPPESGLHLDLNYFDVTFQDRIASITNVAGALNPNSEFASLINRSPDPGAVAALLAEAAALGTSGGFSPSDITVIVDARSTNLAVTDVNGMDIGLSYAFDLGGGDLTLRADATYLFEFLRAASPAARAVDVVDTVSNPVDLRARIGATWRTDHITLSGFVNYTDGFRDNLSAPQRDVDAWTTVDLHASLSLGAGGGEHGVEHEAGPELSLSVLNLFDEEPPFVNNSAGVGYDPANADPLGRFVAFEISTRF